MFPQGRVTTYRLLPSLDAMTARVPWPAELRSRPFTAAQAQSLGIGKRRANGVAVTRPHPRLRSLTPVTSPAQLCRGLAPTLPAQTVFSHVTALRLWDLPWSVPWHLDEPVHVTVGTSRRLRRRGIVTHSRAQGPEVESRYGLPVTTIVDTWADLAALPGVAVPELVAVGDAILWRRRHADAPAGPLLDAVAARGGLPGVIGLRHAVGLMRVGSRSRMETLTRLDFATERLPEPELNGDVTDGPGQWVANCDFVWRSRRVVAEYDGLDHARPQRFRRDAQRRRLIEDAGWDYVQLTATTLYDAHEHAAVIARLRRLLA